jgi:hypothetical protein
MMGAIENRKMDTIAVRIPLFVSKMSTLRFWVHREQENGY